MLLKTKSRAIGLLTALILLGTLAASQTAHSDPPPFNGLMDFAVIHGPADPEDYSWALELGSTQNLREIDDQTAVVEYEDHIVAFTIEAEPAHDVNGTSVPTSIAVSEGDILTLTVHHHAGDPA